MLPLITALAPSILSAVQGATAKKQAKKKAKTESVVSLARQVISSKTSAPVKRNLPPPPAKGGQQTPSDAGDKEDKTLMYVGIGGAVLVVAGLAVFALKD